MEDKIEQYCLLAKGARGRALVDLIQKATGEPCLFAFGEILDIDSVKELQNSEFQSSYQLLKLFAYGTWKDYTGNQGSFPPLDEKQKLKLRQLTIVSIAEQIKVIPYAQLMEELDISNVRELEDLLITECFYGLLMKGKLDQSERCLHVHDVVSRDVSADNVDSIISALGDWLQTSEKLLQELEDKVAYTAQKSAEAQAQKQAFEAKIEEDKNLYKAGPSGSQESMSLEDGGSSMLDYMEQDRGITRPKRRR